MPTANLQAYALSASVTVKVFIIIFIATSVSPCSNRMYLPIHNWLIVSTVHPLAHVTHPCLELEL